jgi:hypothetical protein
MWGTGATAPPSTTEVSVWLGDRGIGTIEGVMNRELLASVDRLVQEFGPRVPAGTVIRCFAVSVRQLRADGVHSGLADAAEAMARCRLDRHWADAAPVS